MFGFTVIEYSPPWWGRQREFNVRELIINILSEVRMERGKHAAAQPLSVSRTIVQDPARE